MVFQLKKQYIAIFALLQYNRKHRNTDAKKYTHTKLHFFRGVQIVEEKTFQETRVQIGLLKSRGVTIKNKRYAKWLIRDVNYYNLINGYKEPFLKSGTAYEQYLPGTTLEEIFALYEFDRKLRMITLEYILEIEKSAKSLIACCFSKAHGHKNYLRLENFDTKGRSKYHQVCGLLSSLYKKISLNIDKDPSISHYVDGKNYIPLWVLVNSISMGDISKFYSNMVQKEREDVARRLKWGSVKTSLPAACFFWRPSGTGAHMTSAYTPMHPTQIYAPTGISAIST